MTGQAQGCRGILEIGVAGIQLLATFLEVGNLARDAYVKNERERVDGRIAGGVDGIHLVVLPVGDAQTVHSTTDAGRLIAEHTQAVLAIGRVGSTLCKYTNCRDSEKECAPYFLFHK